MNKITLLNYTLNSSPNPNKSNEEVEPTPRLNLNNLDGVRREMSRVYRDMRDGSLASQDGTRLVYVLGELRKLFEVCALEKKLIELEDRLLSEKCDD